MISGWLYVPKNRGEWKSQSLMFFCHTVPKLRMLIVPFNFTLLAVVTAEVQSSPSYWVVP